MTTEDRDERDGLDPREDAALWTLLGRREPPAPVSPYFSRRVLREVALAGETRRVGWRASLRRLWPVAPGSRRAAWFGGLSGAAAGALFCLMGGLGALRTNHASPDRTPPEAAVALAATEDSAAPVGTLPPDTGMLEDKSVPVPEVEVIADLDNILQREESRLWTDDNSTARF